MPAIVEAQAGTQQVPTRLEDVSPEVRRQWMIEIIETVSRGDPANHGVTTQEQTERLNVTLAQEEADRADGEKEYTLRFFALLEIIANNPNIELREWAILEVTELVKTLAEARNELKNHMPRKPQDLIEDIGTERLSVNEIRCAQDTTSRPQIATAIRTNPRSTKSIGMPLIWLANRQVTPKDLEIFSITTPSLIVLFENISRITGTRLPTDMAITVNTGLQAIFQEDLQPEERNRNLMKLAALLNQMLAMAQGTTERAVQEVQAVKATQATQTVHATREPEATIKEEITTTPAPTAPAPATENIDLHTTVDRITSPEEANLALGNLTSEIEPLSEIRFRFIFLCITRAKTPEVRIWAIAKLTEEVSLIIESRNAFIANQVAGALPRSLETRRIGTNRVKENHLPDIIKFMNPTTIDAVAGNQGDIPHTARLLGLVIATHKTGVISKALVIVANLLKDLIEDSFLIQAIANPGISHQFTDEYRSDNIETKEDAESLIKGSSKPGRRINAFLILRQLIGIMDSDGPNQEESIVNLCGILSDAATGLTTPQ